jgi:hypothetical protein
MTPMTDQFASGVPTGRRDASRAPQPARPPGRLRDTAPPRILDLFWVAGGASRGYADAGFDVTGVDITPQPDYPYEFLHGDALYVLNMRWLVRTFDAIHASPPCQASSALTKGTNQGRQYEQLIPQVRAQLERIGLPYVIENVQGSDLRRDLTLCGEMFGLDVIRHRYFECSFPVTQPAHIPHRGRVRGWRHGLYHDGPYLAVYGQGGGKGTVTEWQQAMGIDWTADRKAIAEAIPPAYTEHVGLQLAAHLTRKVAA